MGNIGRMGRGLVLGGGVALAVGLGSAYAQSAVPQQNTRQDLQNQGATESFANTRKGVAQRIQDRIKILQKSLDCVNKAQTRDALKECRPAPDKNGAGMPMMRRNGPWGGPRNGGDGY